jgi:hypothetical protein
MANSYEAFEIEEHTNGYNGVRAWSLAGAGVLGVWSVLRCSRVRQQLWQIRASRFVAIQSSSLTHATQRPLRSASGMRCLPSWRKGKAGDLTRMLMFGLRQGPSNLTDDPLHNWGSVRSSGHGWAVSTHDARR